MPVVARVGHWHRQNGVARPSAGGPRCAEGEGQGQRQRGCRAGRAYHLRRYAARAVMPLNLYVLVHVYVCA